MNPSKQYLESIFRAYQTTHFFRLGHAIVEISVLCSLRIVFTKLYIGTVPFEVALENITESNIH